MSDKKVKMYNVLLGKIKSRESIKCLNKYQKNVLWIMLHKHKYK